MSNNAQTCVNNTKDLVHQAEELINAKNPDAETKAKATFFLENFSTDVNKGFMDCRKKANERMALKAFETFFELWKVSKSFLDVDLVYPINYVEVLAKCFEQSNGNVG
jgi:hypothetical protein